MSIYNSERSPEYKVSVHGANFLREEFHALQEIASEIERTLFARDFEPNTSEGARSKKCTL